MIRSPALVVIAVAACAFGGCTRDAPTAKEHVAPPATHAVTTTNAAAHDPIDDDIQAARIMLADGEETNAIGTFDAIRASLPEGDRKNAVACELAVALNNRATHTIDKDARAADKDGRRAVSMCPSDARFAKNLARLLVKRAHDEDFDVEDARSRARAFLEDAVHFDAKNANAQRGLGELLVRDDDFAGALEHLRAAYAIEPTDALKARIDEIEKKAAVEATFTDRSHDHFVVRFEGAKQEQLAWRVLDLLSKDYVDVGERLDVYPREPIAVVIYTGDQYKRAVDAPDWSSGVFDGRIRVREGNIERADLDKLLRHEYVHALLASLRTPIPTWFHEGLAMNLEPVGVVDVDKARVTFSYDALSSGFIELDANTAHEAYAVSASLVRALVDRRGERLRALLSRMKRGDAFADAFVASYDVAPAAFFASWLQTP